MSAVSEIFRAKVKSVLDRLVPPFKLIISGYLLLTEFSGVPAYTPLFRKKGQKHFIRTDTVQFKPYFSDVNVREKGSFFLDSAGLRRNC